MRLEEDGLDFGSQFEGTAPHRGGDVRTAGVWAAGHIASGVRTQRRSAQFRFSFSLCPVPQPMEWCYS